MAIYTAFVEPEDRPNLLRHHIVYAVVDDTTEHIMAYCLSSQDAEFVKAVLVYGAEHMQEFYRHWADQEEKRINALPEIDK